MAIQLLELTKREDLTGSFPTQIDNSTAGLSHIYSIKTPYYTADLPIWIDEISDVNAWCDEFSKDMAREVVSALGAWIYCFRRPVMEEDVVGRLPKPEYEAEAHQISKR